MMKNYLTFTIFLIIFSFSTETSAQEINVSVGDEFVLGTPKNSDYVNLNFPKENMIRKRGGIPDFKALNGQRVVVSKIVDIDSGKKEITLKRVNNKKFFNSVPYITAVLPDAMNDEELKKTK